MKNGGTYATLLLALYVLIVAILGSIYGDWNLFFLANQWVLGLGIVVVFLAVLMIMPTKSQEQRTPLEQEISGQTATQTGEPVEYCSNCGASMLVESKFCKKCGKPQK